MEKKGKSQIIASCGHLQDELLQCIKEERVTMTDGCGNVWGGFENKGQEVGSERKKQERRNAQ